MKKKFTIAVSIALIALTCASFIRARQQKSPLKKAEVLALVAGGVFSENVVHDIETRGIGFTADSNFNSLATKAGADAKLIVALAQAKGTIVPSHEDPSEQALQQHLSKAGGLIRSGDIQGATNELSSALSTPAGTSAAGFVMGEILMRSQQYGDAAQVYAQILEQDSDFPEIHSRLSIALIESDDDEAGFREAKLAMKENPNDALAHRSAGIALRVVGNHDAARAELQRAIHLKPDYDRAHSSLGRLLATMKDYAGAVEEYKKAVVLNSDNLDARYDLGNCYDDLGDHVSAIREYREVKRRDPERLDVRQNLGVALMETDPTAAITEFRELATLAPDFDFCRDCLARALYRADRLPEAKVEYQKAMASDPTNPSPHRGLGLIFESENKYDEALAEFRQAEQLDTTSGLAFWYSGRVLATKKEFAGAISELRHAEELDPSKWEFHGTHGAALEASGDRNGAIAQYKEALSLAPQELQPRVDLALAQEKNGDWVAALGNYRQAAQDQPPMKVTGVTVIRVDAQNLYKQALERFQTHLAELRSSGKSSEASALENSWKSAKSAPNLDAAYHDAMQDSMSAIQQQKFDEAETAAKKAIEIAEKIQPADGRLSESVGQLGNVYAWRRDMKNAGEAFKRQLTLSEKVFGPQSPENSAALQNLGMWAMQQKDFQTAESCLTRMYDLNLKTYGENSAGAADSLRGLAHVYQMKADYPKAEETLLRSVKIYETIYGPENQNTALPWTTLCYVYDQWGKFDKSASCHAHLVGMAEKLFGADSPYLAQDLAGEAHALRQLGRNEEAGKLEERLKSLPSVQSTQMPPPQPGQH